ncbi:MAG: hypothetical protein ACK4PR_10155, partial [Gammaproteobacteria bacterium]
MIRYKKIIVSMGLLLLTESAFAFNWQDLWFRPDQQGIKALQAGQPMQAADLFSSPDWQGVAYYRAGKYQQAAQIFAQDHTAAGFYNQGNALAHIGSYQDAINAYEKAL